MPGKEPRARHFRSSGPSGIPVKGAPTREKERKAAKGDERKAAGG